MKKFVLMTLVALLAFAQGAWADGPQNPQFKYIERSWDDDLKKVVDTEKSTTVYEILQGTENPDAWALLGSKDDQDDHYYVVVRNVTYKTMNVYGKAHIILCDGVTLTCTGGILVEEGHNNAHLFIHGQKNGTGKLIVTNSYNHAAGIGASKAQKSGEITIHGGDLDITGGKYAAGIGGGGPDKYNKGQVGLIQIFGGTINAKGGDYAAGIGGGSSTDGGQLYLYGGNVTATGGEQGAGVGGGGINISDAFTADDPAQLGGVCGSVHVYACTLTAQGGKTGAGIGTGGHAGSSTKSNELYVYHAEAVVTATGGQDAAGIGGGRKTKGIKTHIYAGTVRATGGRHSAGIGGGALDGTTWGYGDDTYIMGGTVIAIAGEGCACRENKGGSAIGCGKDVANKDTDENAGILEFGTNMRVTAGDAENNIECVFISDLRNPACRWRNYVKIEECNHETPTIGSDHTKSISYTYVDAQYHTKQCRYCKYSLQEEHVSSTNCDCGLSTYIPLPKDNDGAFLINSLDDWATFCANVNYGSYNYSGQTVKLTVDISSSTIVGREEYPFAGTFDGNGKTLNINIFSSDNAAPFGWVDNATIIDLHVTGSVQTTKKEGADHTSGLIGRAAGAVTINNVCVSSTITGFNYYGGFIGHGGNNSTINITGCVFDGTLTEHTDGSTQFAGGFIGWGDNMTVNLTNCLFAGTYTFGTSGSGKKNFHPVGYYCKANNTSVTPAMSNVYYTVAPSAQTEENNGVVLSNVEKQVYSITTTDPNVTTLVFSGNATSEYTVSGLKCYATGIVCGTTLYACGDAEVGLTLAHAEASETQYFTNYEVSGGGSFDDATSNTPKLTMTNTDQTISAKYGIVLADNAGNRVVIGDADDGKVYDVKLSGRTLYKDGAWNTLCLPFDVTVGSGQMAGATAKTLNREMSGFVASTGVLTLNFDNVGTGSTIAAGTPFIVKWTGTDVTNPEFKGVTVSSTAEHSVVTTDLKVSFNGNYSPVILEANEKSYLYLGGNNKLYYPTVNLTLNSFRAYFHVKLGEATEVRQFVMNFGDDNTTTGISLTPNPLPTGEGSSWYTIDGRKLNGKTTQKGVYINNGKKIVIK